MSAEWTEGVCGDGAVILRDGQPVSISDVLSHLNGLMNYARLTALLQAAIADRLSGADVTDEEFEFAKTLEAFVAECIRRDREE